MAKVLRLLMKDSQNFGVSINHKGYTFFFIRNKCGMERTILVDLKGVCYTKEKVGLGPMATLHINNSVACLILTVGVV